MKKLKLPKMCVNDMLADMFEDKMEKLDLNSIEKTELLASSAAKDKILIKPKRTSTRQQAHKQHNATHPACLPKLAEEIRSTPDTLRGNQESVSTVGTIDGKITVSGDKPLLQSMTSNQTKVNSNSTRGMTKVDSSSTRGMTKVNSNSTRGMTKVDSSSTRGMTKGDASFTRSQTQVDSSSTRSQIQVDSSSTRSQTQVDTSFSRTGNRTQLFTTNGGGKTGESPLTSPAETTTLAPIPSATTTITTLASQSTGATPTSPRTVLPPSGSKTATAAHWVSQSEHANSQSASPACSPSAHSICQPDESNTSPSQLDSRETEGEIKTEINIKSMMSRFQPPPSSNKSSPSRLVKWAELDTNGSSHREESHRRLLPGRQISSSVSDVIPTESSTTPRRWTTVIQTPATSTLKLHDSSSASVDSAAAASARESSWLGKKTELHVGVENKKSATAANSLANSSVSKSATTANSLTAANSFISMSATTADSLINTSVSNSATAANSLINSPVSKSATTDNSLTNSSLSKSTTQENIQRWSSRLRDHPPMKMNTSSSLESKMAGLQEQVGHLFTDKTDSTQQEKSQTTANQINSVKTSRSFSDCSSHLNTQTNHPTADICKSATHLKSAGQSVPFGSEAGRKPETSDDEHSQSQAHTGMSAFSHRQTPEKVVSSVSTFNLPSLTPSNRARASLVLSDPGSAASSSLSGAATPDVLQSSCIQPSLVKSIKNTAYLASTAKPTGFTSQTCSKAVTGVSTGVTVQLGYKAATGVSPGISSQKCSKAVTGISTGVTVQLGYKAASDVSPGVSSQTGSKADRDVSTGGPRLSGGFSNRAVFASEAAGQVPPHISNLNSHGASSSFASTTSSRIVSAMSNVSAPSAAASITNSSQTCSPLGKSSLSKPCTPEIQSTSTQVKHTVTSSSPGMPANKLPKTNISQGSTASDETLSTGVKDPPWRLNQLKKDVQVEIVDKKDCNHGNILEPPKKSLPSTDAATAGQTDKLFIKPSKVLNLVKNFQNCQVPS